jgi:regulator of protease activity HflC (stomatin/prohibitin superfamily)
MPFSPDMEVRSLAEMVQESPYAKMNTIETTNALIKEFNQGRESIMTNGLNWLFKHTLVMPNEFRLVEKNGIPELVGAAPIPQRRKKIFNFQDSSSTLGIYNQNTPLIGANGHYLVNVPPGKYAKIFDGNKAVLLGSGQHVLHSNNFRFKPEEDMVSQTSDFITHNDLHIVRVPQGSVAVIRINNETMFLEHRKTPYSFKAQQFQLISPKEGLFYPANSKILYAGTTIRLLPDSGEVGVLNSGGTFKIIQPAANQVGPIIEEIGSARFDGYLPTSLQNVEFPSESVRKRNMEQGIKKEDANFDYYYTADQVKVGVRFLVNYRIQDPKNTLSTLKLADIRAHIESVVTADMGNAIKKTSMQDLLSSDLSSIPGDHLEDSTNGFNHWQDTVKTNLKKDLAEYGIELIRLNIEEAKILNPEIEQQMSQQAIAYATAHAQKLSLQASLEIKQAEAEQRRILAKQQQETDSEIATIKADAEVRIAEKKGKASRTQTDAAVYNQKEIAKALENSPQALILSFLKELREALTGGHFTSALPLSDLSNFMATFMEKISTIVNTQSTAAKNKVTFFQPTEQEVANEPYNSLTSVDL